MDPLNSELLLALEAARSHLDSLPAKALRGPRPLSGRA